MKETERPFVKLKVTEALTKDVGRALVRMGPEDIERLQAEIGEPIPPETVELWSAEGPDVFLENLRSRIEELRMRCRAKLRERTRGAFPPPGPADRPYWEDDA